MPPVFDLSKCSGCGECEKLCMADAIYMSEIRQGIIRPYVKYPDECWHCGACRQDCPSNAISIVFPPSMLTI
jgi:adenylylsulfate reductase subunit B